MSFFQSEYFQNDEGDDMEESSTYPITDSFAGADDSLRGIGGDHVEQDDLLGMPSVAMGTGQASYDVGEYDIDNPSSLLKSHPEDTDDAANPTEDGDDTGAKDQKQQSSVISFSRANYKASYLGAMPSANLGRSSAIASMMGVTGMAPTTPKIGGVRSFQDGDDDGDDKLEDDEIDGDEDGGKKSKKKETKKEKKDKGEKKEKKEKQEKQEKKEKKKKKKRQDNDKNVTTDGENVHPIDSNADDGDSVITKQDLSECVDILCSEESVQWSLKIWAIEVGNRLGIDVKSRPDIKNTLRGLVLEKATVSKNRYVTICQYVHIILFYLHPAALQIFTLIFTLIDSFDLNEVIHSRCCSCIALLTLIRRTFLILRHSLKRMSIPLSRELTLPQTKEKKTIKSPTRTMMGFPRRANHPIPWVPRGNPRPKLKLK